MSRVSEVHIDTEGLQNYRDSHNSDTGCPRLSVIIPVYNDSEGLLDTVNTLYQQHYSNIEILAIIEPSSGATVDTAKMLARELDPFEFLSSTEYDTPAAARNAGISVASGGVLVFVDANIIPEDDFIWKISFVFSNTGVDYLGMPVEVGLSESPSTLVAWYDRQIRYPVEYYLKGAKFAPTCALAVRQEICESIRFESNLIAAEDVFFGKLAYKQEFQFAYCPDISVVHPERSRISDILAVGEKTGRGFYQTYHHLPVTLFSTKPRTLTINGYTPRSISYLKMICPEWNSLTIIEKLLIMLFAYVEVLARTLGYIKQGVDERTSSAEQA